MITIILQYIVLFSIPFVMHKFDRKLGYLACALPDQKYLYYFSMIMFELALLFNIAYTWYFGWNMEPINKTELWMDNIVMAIHITSITVYLYVRKKMQKQLTLIIEFMNRGK